MNNTVISIKIDKNTKKAAQEVAKSAGLNLSSLVNSYLKQVVATRRIELYAPEVMTAEVEQAIALVEKDIAKGGLSKIYTDVDEFLADLKK